MKIGIFSLLPHAKTDNFAGGNGATYSCVFSFIICNSVVINRALNSPEAKLNRVLVADFYIR